mmetsp:Transcript_60783/g.146949  ORF Transcript_60783/g.146949 Transcript_60783/m.146949 type:complete len:225 (-) Transcript_60783:1388-2062(-)
MMSNERGKEVPCASLAPVNPDVSEMVSERPLLRGPAAAQVSCSEKPAARLSSAEPRPARQSAAASPKSSSVLLWKKVPTVSMLGRALAWNSMQCSTQFRQLARLGSRSGGQDWAGIFSCSMHLMISCLVIFARGMVPVSVKNARRPKEKTSVLIWGRWPGDDTSSGAIQMRVPPKGMACLVRARARPKSSSFMRWKPLRPGTRSAMMFDALKSPWTTGGSRECR